MNAHRDRLFAALAVQVELIDTAQCVQVWNAWTGRRERALADLVVDWGWITLEDRADVERLMGRKLRKHGDDPARLLAALAHGPIRRLLVEIGSDDAGQSTGELPPRPEEPMHSTFAGADPRGGEVGFLVADPAPEPESPDHYDMTRLHARGGMGRIWLARDGRLGREVALKELRPERADNPTARARLLDEARITSQLQHPGVAPVYELVPGNEGQSPYYTMRLVPGRTLSQAARSYRDGQAEGRAGVLERNGLLRAFVDLCNTLAYAHSRGVLHRDLKGSNVILGDFGEVVLLDWGLAKVLGQAEAEPDLGPVILDPDRSHATTRPGKSLGTPAYMPPEQAAGRLDQVDVRSDVFGLGAILYEILTGQPPYVDREDDEVLRQALECRPTPPRRLDSTIPLALEAICLKALAPGRDDRYDSATALRLDVERFLADEPVAAVSETRRDRLARWARRHPPAVAVAVVFLLVGVTALAVSNVLVGREQSRVVREKRRADVHLAITLDALERILYQVDHGGIGRLPGARPIVGQIMADATALFGTLRHQNPNDPAILRGDARSCRRLGNTHRAMGDYARAATAYDRALATLRTLVDLPLATLEDRRELARTLLDQAELHRLTGRPATAEGLYRQSLAQFEALAAELPDDTALPRERAGVANDLGLCLRDADRRVEAEAAFGQGLSLLEGATARFGPQPRYRRQRVQLLNDLGLLLAETGRPDQAERRYREAIALAEALMAEAADAPEHHHLLASALNKLAGVMANRPDDCEAAIALTRRARTLFEALAQTHPDVPRYSLCLCYCANQTGAALARMGRLDEAEAALHEGLQLIQELEERFPNQREARDLRKTLEGNLERIALARN